MIIKSLCSVALVATLSACAAVDANIETSRIVQNPTLTQGPMDKALACLAQFPGEDVRIGVSNIDDLTGRYDLDGQGAYLTRGGSYMLMTAFSKAGIKQVQRANTKAIEWERSLALKKGLGDNEKNMVGGKEVDYRLTKTGSILGSTHIASGAFTALDFNIASGGLDVSVGGVGAGARSYRMALGFDFIITDTKSTEILYAESYSKALTGQEYKAGIFRFFTGNLVDASGGFEAHDPIQFGSQYILNYAAYDIARKILNAGDACDSNLPEVYGETLEET